MKDCLKRVKKNIQRWGEHNYFRLDQELIPELKNNKTLAFFSNETDELFSQIMSHEVNSFYFLGKTGAYLVCMNKENFLNKDESYDYFHIPPYSCEVSWALEGEDFDPRTKVIMNNEGHFNLRLGLDCLLPEKYLKTPLNEKVTRYEFEERSQKYLIKNTLLLKQDNKLANQILRGSDASDFLKLYKPMFLSDTRLKGLFMALVYL